MLIVGFIRRAQTLDLALVLAMSALAGVANAVLLVVINQVATMVALGRQPSVTSGLIFVSCFLAYYILHSIALRRAIGIIEAQLKLLRLQMVDRLRQSELSVIERLGRGNLFTLVAQETNRLSVAFPLLMDCFQQTILLAVALLYLLWLSPAAFAVFLAAMVFGAALYRRIQTEYREPTSQVIRDQARLLDAVGDVVDGFKEVRLNSRRSTALHDAFIAVANQAKQSRLAAGDYWAALILLSSAVTYFMLGVVAFVLPAYISAHGAAVFQVVPTLLFCIGPVGRIASQAPMFMQAESGLRAIRELELALAAAGNRSPDEARRSATDFTGFGRIELQGVTLHRWEADGTLGFTSGPLDLDVNRGEVLFLIGGNGSGKSTALRLCTGLLHPDSGRILVDGVPVTDRTLAGYRELFAAVFADFHLFARPQGLDGVDPARVTALLSDMDLAHKVRFEGGRFSNVKLSTGQRKRLALIVAILEDRPVIVFDEWAAEQDAQFRDAFYRRILPSLKEQGKTILAVTHDDLYFDFADRVVTLDLGRVVSVRRPRSGD